MKTVTLKHNFYKKSTEELLYSAGEVVSDKELDSILICMSEGHYKTSTPIFFKEKQNVLYSNMDG